MGANHPGIIFNLRTLLFSAGRRNVRYKTFFNNEKSISLMDPSANVSPDILCETGKYNMTAGCSKELETSASS